jgi:hypothetical protein
MWERLLPSTEDHPTPGSLSGMPDRGPFVERTREATPASSAATQLTQSAGTPANETFLATSAKEIHISLSLGRCDLVGRLLAEVKERVGHGPWLHWVQREFGWSESTTLKFMRFHEALDAMPEPIGGFDFRGMVTKAELWGQLGQALRDNSLVNWDVHRCGSRRIIR